MGWGKVDENDERGSTTGDIAKKEKPEILRIQAFPFRSLLFPSNDDFLCINGRNRYGRPHDGFIGV